MINLADVRREIVSDKTMPSFITQTMVWEHTNKECKALCLTTDCVFNYTNVSMSCLESSKYLVRLIMRATGIRQLAIPNRVCILDVESSLIECMNNNIFSLNKKRNPILLQKKLLRVNFNSTRVFRPPFGFFIWLYMSSCVTNKVVRMRESIIIILYSGPREYTLRHTIKSIRMTKNCSLRHS